MYEFTNKEVPVMFILMHNGKRLGFYHTRQDAENNKHRWASMYNDNSYEVVYVELALARA